MNHVIHCGGEQSGVGEHRKTVFRLIQLKPKTTELNNISEECENRYESKTEFTGSKIGRHYDWTRKLKVKLKLKHTTMFWGLFVFFCA